LIATAIWITAKIDHNWAMNFMDFCASAKVSSATIWKYSKLFFETPSETLIKKNPHI